MNQYIKIKKIIFVFLLFTLIFSFAHAANAQKKKKNNGIIRLEVTTIEGRVQKPNAFFINTRQGLVYKSVKVKESFVGEISKVVDQGDF